MGEIAEYGLQRTGHGWLEYGSLGVVSPPLEPPMTNAPLRAGRSGTRLTHYQSATLAGTKRAGVTFYFEVLDLDDHQSFGGKV